MKKEIRKPLGGRGGARTHGAWPAQAPQPLAAKAAADAVARAPVARIPKQTNTRHTRRE